jgi:hypothetical protein
MKWQLMSWRPKDKHSYELVDAFGSVRGEVEYSWQDTLWKATVYVQSEERAKEIIKEALNGPRV